MLFLYDMTAQCCHCMEGISLAAEPVYGEYPSYLDVVKPSGIRVCLGDISETSLCIEADFSGKDRIEPSECLKYVLAVRIKQHLLPLVFFLEREEGKKLLS